MKSDSKKEATTIGRGFLFVHNEFSISRHWIQLPAKN
jgi:hypothetical protein